MIPCYLLVVRLHSRSAHSTCAAGCPASLSHFNAMGDGHGPAEECQGLGPTRHDERLARTPAHVRRRATVACWGQHALPKWRSMPRWVAAHALPLRVGTRSHRMDGAVSIATCVRERREAACPLWSPLLTTSRYGDGLPSPGSLPGSAPSRPSSLLSADGRRSCTGVC